MWVMLLVLGAFSFGSLPSPSPAPPLKTITTVRSSPLCTALRENIGPSIHGLIQNNVAIGKGKSLFLKMTKDLVSRYDAVPKMNVDMVQLDRVVAEMVHNLAAVNAALSDSARFIGKPATDDQRRFLEMRRQLQALAERQNEALNVFSGTYYDYSSNQLQFNDDRAGLATLPIAMQNETSEMTAAPSPSPKPTSASIPLRTPSPSGTPATIDIGLAGGTTLNMLFNSITTYQVQEAPLESQAAKTILQTAAECNGKP